MNVKIQVEQLDDSAWKKKAPSPLKSQPVELDWTPRARSNTPYDTYSHPQQGKQ